MKKLFFTTLLLELITTGVLTIDTSSLDSGADNDSNPAVRAGRFNLGR